MALTLKTLCGLSVEEIARAFLVPAPPWPSGWCAPRARSARARIPYEVPRQRPPGRAAGRRAARRLPGLQRGLRGDLGRRARAPRAVRARPSDWAGCCVRCCPPPARSTGLLALMLLQDSRRAARLDAQGELVTLEEQDRSLWDRGADRRGAGPAPRRRCAAAARGSTRCRRPSPPCTPRRRAPQDTDWPQIAALYALLLRLHPSPVVALNHAAAVAMGERLDRGLRLIEQLEATGELDGYHLLPAAKADILRRLGRPAEAAAAYERALAARHPGRRAALPGAPAAGGALGMTAALA